MTDQLLWYYLNSVVATFVVTSVSIWKGVAGNSSKETAFAVLMTFTPIANTMFTLYLVYKMLCKEK